MEGLFIELARSLAAHGPAYTLLAIVGVALAYVTHRWIKAEGKCFDLSSTLNEKRLTERSETIAVLHAGTQTNEKLASSIAVRTETLNNLIVVVTAGNDRIEARLAEGIQRLAEVLRRLEDRHVGKP